LRRYQINKYKITLRNGTICEIFWLISYFVLLGAAQTRLLQECVQVMPSAKKRTDRFSAASGLGLFGGGAGYTRRHGLDFRCNTVPVAKVTKFVAKALVAKVTKFVAKVTKFVAKAPVAKTPVAKVTVHLRVTGTGPIGSVVYSWQMFYDVDMISLVSFDALTTTEWQI
jgi:hypothetical protein